MRHGETDLNKAGIIMGSVDGPLNATGFEQAQKAALILKAINFDVVVSSPRTRALQTAESVRQDKPLYSEPNLAERVWGEAEGRHHTFTKSLFDENYTPMGAESVAEFRARILEGLSVHLRKDQTVLFVSHGGVFKVLSHALGHQNLTSFNAVPYLFRPLEHEAHPWFICELGEV